MRVALPYCVRCGPLAPHPKPTLDFAALAEPVVGPDGTVWTHAAACPVTGERVLMRLAGLGHKKVFR